MIKQILTSLLLLALAATYAAEPSPTAIDDQKDDQSLCIQQRIDLCIKKLCQSKEEQNCVNTCELTVKNECRQAGE
ncbi:hypothetical protein BN59_03315 [Legionella massiliensis]|uniref:Cysteine rich repeat n=1 Tax=Legionella massiliensis TaxID=1034943 RepID=A0A078KX76_9GAMM|nr:hypothetical protein [Legionella massiliensis]CDZ79000.1 hypothetical protein BN59_03315 [Legionella massiliensis]CEE14738.1 hypothetical protein BN1094_03315 [Legionella massiliensis]